MNREASTLLLQEARAGSPEALARLYERYGARVLAFIRLKMGRDLRARVESRDVLQATLMKSFERLDQFAGDSSASLMGWLARIAENEIRDQADFHGRHRRAAAVEVAIDGSRTDLRAPARSALSEVIAAQEAERLSNALESLDPDHRDVIVLRKLEERSFRDIALRMGRSEDACRMLLARAMVALTHAMRTTA
jgi:RNA polymerase sigma-70 factor (ECF subfamily)